MAKKLLPQAEMPVQAAIVFQVMKTASTRKALWRRCPDQYLNIYRPREVADGKRG
jgi:hypothetical protein